MKKPVHPKEQSLFAQVVVKSASDATRILDKPDNEGKVKFSVNGEDLRPSDISHFRISKGRRNQSQVLTRLEGL
ncbi:hypothetical protein ACFX1X_029872 [Malus domestica]